MHAECLIFTGLHAMQNGIGKTINLPIYIVRCIPVPYCSMVYTSTLLFHGIYRYLTVPWYIPVPYCSMVRYWYTPNNVNRKGDCLTNSTCESQRNLIRGFPFMLKPLTTVKGIPLNDFSSCLNHLQLSKESH